MSEVQTQPAAIVPANPTTEVANQIRDLVGKGRLHLPGDYSPDNALKSAYLTLRDVKSKEGHLALQHCTRDSIINALYDMVVQGLDPMKKQCYFIVRGKTLCMDRSYMGEVTLAERVKPGLKVSCDVVYKGESIKLKKITNKFGFVTVILDHELLENRGTQEIERAYATAHFVTPEGEVIPYGSLVMDIAQIKTSWKKSPTYREDSKTFHNEQPDIACMRTAVRRLCKPIIGTSTDEALMASVRRQEEAVDDAEFSEAINLNANGDELAIIDAEATEESTEGKEGEDDKKEPVAPQKPDVGF